MPALRSTDNFLNESSFSWPPNCTSLPPTILTTDTQNEEFKAITTFNTFQCVSTHLSSHVKEPKLPAVWLQYYLMLLPPTDSFLKEINPLKFQLVSSLLLILIT